LVEPGELRIVPAGALQFGLLGPLVVTVDGRPVDLLKAYASVRAVPRNFLGFYADISLLTPDRDYKLDLELPPGLKAGRFQGVFVENVETEYTTEIVN